MKELTVCYVGITKSGFSRAGVQIGALRAAGVVVKECFDESRGLLKFWRLFKKHQALGSYDVLIVGYPGAIAVPLARIMSRKPVIFDAAWTLYEGIVLARGRHRKNPLGRFIVWLIDRIGYQFANLVLLDTNEQRMFYQKLMRANPKKLRTLYTGCDETSFFPDESVPKRTRFTAVFRGKYNIEAGLPHVLDAARILENAGIDFRIYSPGYKPTEPVPTNTSIITDFFSLDELRRRMSECHVSIGQMAVHQRLSHTIPHKAFESLSMRIPYVTARSKAMSELANDEEGCVMVEAGDAASLASAIVRLRDEPLFQASVADAGQKSYRNVASWQKISTALISFILEAGQRSVAVR